MSAKLSIKDVPDPIAEGLRQRAARNHRSLQGEWMAIVEQAAAEATPAEAAARRVPVLGWQSIEQLMAERESAGWHPDASLQRAPLAVDILRADRDAR